MGSEHVNLKLFLLQVETIIKELKIKCEKGKTEQATAMHGLAEQAEQLIQRMALLVNNDGEITIYPGGVDSKFGVEVSHHLFTGGNAKLYQY